MDIVPVKVPALFGLDVLNGGGLYADNVKNRLVHLQVIPPGELPDYKDRSSVPQVRQDNQLCAKMRFPRSTFYTTAQL